MGRHYNRPLRRGAPKRQPRKRLLVLCEGKVTEPKYLNAFRHEHRSQLVEVEVMPECGDPKTLVEQAVERKKYAEREARRYSDPYRKYDEVWCVFDVDEHLKLAEAKQQARDNGLNLAISSPCFELWILLHFQDQQAHIERDVLRVEVRKHLPGYEKVVPYDKVQPHYEEAVLRANALTKWQIEQGRPKEEENPSTGVHKLTKRIAELGRDRFLNQKQG